MTSLTGTGQIDTAIVKYSDSNEDLQFVSQK